MSFFSLSQMYGGLLTTTSHCSPHGVRLSASRRSTVTAASLARAFSCATSSATGDMSHADTSLPGTSSASVTAMQPLPVPISTILDDGQPCLSAVIRAQSSSVSGRGISMPGRTLKRLPPNSAQPMTYCTGSPYRSLLNMPSSFASSSAASDSTAPHIMSALPMPKPASST